MTTGEGFANQTGPDGDRAGQKRGRPLVHGKPALFPYDKAVLQAIDAAALPVSSPPMPLLSAQMAACVRFEALILRSRLFR